MTLDHAIERLYALKVDTTTRDGDGTPHEKPHKPLLLLAVFDLIDQGLATPDHIPWCQALRDRFSARFEVVRKLNERNNPDLPFRYLAGDDLNPDIFSSASHRWTAFAVASAQSLYDLGTQPEACLR